MTRSQPRRSRSRAASRSRRAGVARWRRPSRAVEPRRRRGRAPHVEALASERLEGRLAGSNGERLAADYIVVAAEADRRAAAARRRPTTGCRSSSPPARAMAARRLGVDGATAIAARVQRSAPDDPGAVVLRQRRSVSGRSSSPATASSCPTARTSATTATPALDVKDKVVVVLRYFPEDADPKTKGILARYADLRYKAMAARQRGAKAMLVVTGPRSPNAGETVPMTFDTALAGSGIVAASISGAVGDAISRRHRQDARGRAAQSLDSGNPHVAGFDIPQRDGHDRTTSVVREKRTGHNVVGYLPATRPTGRRQQAVGCARRALRSPRTRRERQLAGRQATSAARCTSAPTTTRRAAAAVLASARRLAAQTRAAGTCCSRSGRARSSG